MCRYIETTHTYTDCKLLDDLPDSSPNLLASFFRRITKAALGASTASSPVDLQSPHPITEKQVIQCLAAAQDEAQEATPREERQCAEREQRAARPEEPVPIRVGETEHSGECPACKAAETAVQRALNTTVMISVEFPMTEPPSVPAQAAATGHHPHRHHGKERKTSKRKKTKRRSWF